ncbi:MAG: hypothetical protein K9L87_03290 [Candidatus Omnitrophica bacterium]|nr:hypothetical protein [Candidatus Omnitrophota bacterium]MCF7897755.1 hypothetical protein [Candidatus Omnitrophota bacterium]
MLDAKNKIMRIIKYLFAATLALAFFSSVTTLYAKRLPPKEVSPAIYNSIEFRASHNKMGYIEAFDVETGEKLWEEKVYHVKIDPKLETDVQWIFITELKLRSNKLVIINERGNEYKVNIIITKERAIILVKNYIKKHNIEVIDINTPLEISENEDCWNISYNIKQEPIILPPIRSFNVHKDTGYTYEVPRE